MKSYIIQRIIWMMVLLFSLSIISFVLIQLPPGSFVDMVMLQEEAGGQWGGSRRVTADMRIMLEEQYGINEPVFVQYFKWIKRIILYQDFGISFIQGGRVTELIAERLPVSVMLSSLSFLFVYLLAIPIGIYSAVHQYSISDYTFTILGFIGLATPNFLLALLFMIFFQQQFGWSVGGLFSREYILASWSVGKFFDLLKHLPIPIVVIGTAGTAGIIRVLRGCLLDELRKQYVITARAKGVQERVLLFKYPVRVAVNPIISTIGWMLPAIISGETITSIVIGIPSIGPLLFSALRAQDMYLAGGIIMLLGFLTVIGTFISDMLLIWLDPRIRYQK